MGIVPDARRDRTRRRRRGVGGPVPAPSRGSVGPHLGRGAAPDRLLHGRPGPRRPPRLDHRPAGPRGGRRRARRRGRLAGGDPRRPPRPVPAGPRLPRPGQRPVRHPGPQPALVDGRGGGPDGRRRGDAVPGRGPGRRRPAGRGGRLHARAGRGGQVGPRPGGPPRRGGVGHPVLVARRPRRPGRGPRAVDRHAHLPVAPPRLRRRRPRRGADGRGPAPGDPVPTAQEAM